MEFIDELEIIQNIQKKYQKEEGDPNQTCTENGDKAYLSTMNSLVDLYYKSIRDVDSEELKLLFESAWESNPYFTLRCIAHIRDIRGGKGERQIGRTLLDCVAKKSIEILRKNAHAFFHVYGRWDDGIFQSEEDEDGESIYSEELKTVYVEEVVKQLRQDMEALEKGNSVSLCAKWIPSEKSKHGSIYKAIVKAYGLNYATFRKSVLVPLRRKIDILETKLCKRDYESINYEKVPSCAMNQHSKKPKRHQSENAFMRNDASRFMEYKSQLASGSAKINASVLFPHEIVLKYCDKNRNMLITLEPDELVEAQWKSMVEKVATMGSLNEMLVLADVSGSMSGMPMTISYTMGVLISSIAKNDVWKSRVLTFEAKPKLVKIEGETLFEKLKSIREAPWGGNTNFVAAMKVILDFAKKYQLSQEDLPKKLLVVSDMQFDVADRSMNESSFEVIRRQFAEHGYELPQIIFWNVRSTSTVPEKSNVKGVSLVSGYSPNVLRGVMGEEVITAEETMMNAIMDKRYDLITI